MYSLKPYHLKLHFSFVSNFQSIDLSCEFCAIALQASFQDCQYALAYFCFIPSHSTFIRYYFQFLIAILI